MQNQEIGNIARGLFSFPKSVVAAFLVAAIMAGPEPVSGAPEQTDIASYAEDLKRASAEEASASPRVEDVPSNALEDQIGVVTYSDDSDSAFAGDVDWPVSSSDEVTSSGTPAGPSARFSSVRNIDGGIEIEVVFNNTGKTFRAFVDSDGDIMQMRGETIQGKIATLEPKDRAEWHALSRAMEATYDDASPVRERLGRFANFLMGTFPTGMPVDWTFIKKAGRNPKTGAATFVRCTRMDYTMTAMFRPWFVIFLRRGLLDWWLEDRGWHYDAAIDSVCGMTDTTICGYVGKRYRDQPGWVTINPLFAKQDPKRETEAYNKNQMPIATIGLVPGTTEFEYCAGRCGPGCSGAIGDYYTLSDFHLSAECFAHDACLGEVGSDFLSSVGPGHACADELLNATWGYLNGASCSNASKATLLGWWSFAADGRSLYRLDADGKVKTWSSFWGFSNAGEYVVNVNSLGERWMMLREEGATGPGRVLTGKISKTMPHTLVGNFTNTSLSGAPVMPFAASKSNITAIVTDAITKKPVPDVAVTIEGDTLDKVKKWNKTNQKGFFSFYNLTPHDKYELKLEKVGYATFEEKMSADVGPLPVQFKLVPEGFIGRSETADGRIDWMLRGPDPETVWEGGWDGTVNYYWYIPPEDGTLVTFKAVLTPYTCCESAVGKPAHHSFFWHLFGTIKSSEFACKSIVTREISKEFVLSGDGNIDAAFFASPCGPQFGFVQVTLNPHPGPPKNGSKHSSAASVHFPPADIRVFTAEGVSSQEEKTDSSK